MDKWVSYDELSEFTPEQEEFVQRGHKITAEQRDAAKADLFNMADDSSLGGCLNLLNMR